MGMKAELMLKLRRPMPNSSTKVRGWVSRNIGSREALFALAQVRTPFEMWARWFPTRERLAQIRCPEHGLAAQVRGPDERSERGSVGRRLSEVVHTAWVVGG